MTKYVNQAIEDAMNGQKVFCKFLSANDTGLTGGHQCGIYVSKPAVSILFDTPCLRENNVEKNVKITWQNDFTTDSRFIYYGKGTRNEYRITRFGRGFDLLDVDYTGALFVLIKLTSEDYKAYVLNTDEEIEQFLTVCNISATETNNLVTLQYAISNEEREEGLIREFINGLKEEFPSSEIMSLTARNLENQLYDHEEDIVYRPDSKLIKWTSLEYKIFRMLEHFRYSEQLQNGFVNIEDFIQLANTVLNRRKSRAGKSLENHLSAIFDANQIEYVAQAVTEKNKKPDFLFPSSDAYHNSNFSVDKIVSLAAKTTCKDRWRQILNEADRLRDKTKYLCTLQQGVSLSQMQEMESEKVVLVVPEEYIIHFPPETRERIWSIKKFVGYVKEVESI